MNQKYTNKEEAAPHSDWHHKNMFFPACGGIQTNRIETMPIPPPFSDAQRGGRKLEFEHVPVSNCK